jgi:acyl-lipid omega-6 desaturase (Delta-12 desaturase)
MYGVSLAQDRPEADVVANDSDVRQRIRLLSEHCQRYKGADIKRGVFQLATTGLLFLATLAAMTAAFYHQAWWLSALLIVPASGFLVRLFIVQHDCGHGSFFSSRRANDITGRVISLFTFTPYDYWKRAHNMHHAGSGNLNRRGIGSIDTLTVREYQALPPKKKFAYRLYRNPFLLLLVFTPYYVLLLQRSLPSQTLPYLDDYHTMKPRQALRSVVSLNIALAVFYGAAALLLGWEPVVLLYLPVMILTSWVGGWLFYIQHQFEDGYWEREGTWSFGEAAVLGSSYYALPRVLQWFTGNIGLHHIHHLCSAIPNYRLQTCLDNSPELQTMNRMTLTDSLKCVWWALWDEDQSKMVGFRDLQAA